MSEALSAFLIHRLMVIFKQKSRFPETLKLFSVQFVYCPVVAILQLPNTYHTYVQISWIKSSGLNLTEAVQKLQEMMPPSGGDLVVKLEDVAGTGSLALNSLILAIFAECLTQWYGNDRFRTYMAVTAGTAIAIAPSLIFVLPLALMNLYVHIR